MDWFQRYGIPGTYFWGLFALWYIALYNCEVKNIDIEKIKLFAGIVVGFFLPTGYLLTIMQQIIYLKWRRWPYFGMTIRAVKKANIFSEECIKGKKQDWLESQACLFEIDKNIKRKKQNSEESIQNNMDAERSRFLSEWIRSRNNVMAINASLILATIFAPLIVLLLKFPFGLSFQQSCGWIYLVSILSLLIFFVLGWSWKIMRDEVVRIEAGIYKMRIGEPASKLVLRKNTKKGEGNVQEPNPDKDKNQHS
jgi:hypothetical protein